MTKMTLTILSILFLATATQADTSLTAYGTYWNAEESGKGAGLRLKKTILGFAAIDARGGYTNFNNADLDAVPLEFSLNARLPFMISPYAGIGAGYYLLDSNQSAYDNASGYFAQIGVEVTFIWIGAMAELRWHDIEENYLDGTSVNAGLLIKW